MDDARLAAALARGADSAVAVVFDYYAHQLYDYCLTFLADPDAAADALHEAMLVAAAWAPALADRSALVPWLHAITRNECLRKLRRGDRAFHVSLTGEIPRPVRPSVGRSDPLLREVTDLVNRYHFGPAEIGLIIGVPVRRARSLCARSASVLSRDRRTGATIGMQVRPGLPHGLREKVIAAAAMPDRVAYRGELALPRLRTGFPAPRGHVGAQAQRRTAMLKVAAVALVLSGVVLAFAVPALSRHSVLGLIHISSPADTNTEGDAGGRTPDPRESAPGWEPSASPISPGPARTGPITGIEGKCMDVRSSSQLSGTPIDLFPCNATPAQQWTVSGDGTIQAFSKCLGVTGATVGARAQIVPCTGDRSQRWSARSDGALVHIETGRCLEVPTARPVNYTVLSLANCVGQPGQIWRLPV